ncbi:MAG TPA: PilN domain-containing protein [Burkholderiales bacterium]|jgi:Tfp pilus assembly protein PilN|nr:PilN domain-containing protein [Burkholderiales bacterium]
MIKINLLPQKRAKIRGAAIAAREPGTKDIFIGVGALAIAALGVFLIVDAPRRSKLSGLRDANAQLDKEIAAKDVQLKGFAETKKAADEALERAKAINRLNQAKVLPANVLHELSQILSNVGPTMTEEMARKTGTGAESDPNKRFDLAWDPTHVWMTSFTDNVKDGTFKLEGGAQAQIDIIQLSKRLQASVYFDHVSQQQEERQTDRETGITFYRFVITGKVAY